MSSSFESFSDLPEFLQLEAIREAEARLSAQLSVAADADKRALSWSGFLLTGASALLATGLGAISSDEFDQTIILGAFLWGGALLVAAWTALSTVKPREFCLPGNRPAHWLPSEWECDGSEAAKVQRARIDQARHLDKMIVDNAKLSKDHALCMHISFFVAQFSVGSAAIIFFLMILAHP